MSNSSDGQMARTACERKRRKRSRKIAKSQVQVRLRTASTLISSRANLRLLSLTQMISLFLVILISSSSIEIIYQNAAGQALERRPPELESSAAPSEYGLRESAQLVTDGAASELLAAEASHTGDQEEPLEAGDQTRPYDYHANMPVITKRELAAAVKQASARVDQSQLDLGEAQANGSARDELENAVQLDVGSPGWLASSMFHKAAPADSFVLNQTRQALISEETARVLARQHKLTRAQVQRGLPLISVDQTSLGRQCPRRARTFSCIPGRYRSLTGHCNNVQQADWGSAQTPLVRYAPALYADHVARPLKSARDEQAASTSQSAWLLPSARQVSLAVHEAAQLDSATQPHAHMTTMLSFFGQFLFHDLAFVPQISKSPNCCAGRQPANRPKLAECMPIEFEGFCLDYVRSAPAVRPGCNLGPRDQLNLVSSFLDGSAIYGSSEAQMRQLRSFAGGRLRSWRTRTPPAGSSQPAQLELLPRLELNPDPAQGNATASDEGHSHWLAAARECLAMARMRSRASGQSGDSASCFQAGDLRANENIGLTLMHTIWMREHNWLADQLAKLNPHWRDERLFEEARRIVVAELQHIAYAEFLPAILGDEVMARFNLTVGSQGYSQSYDPQLDPGVSNELATAVFPFILATIPSALERYSERLEMLGSTSLADTFMDSSDLLKRNKFAQYLTGMMSQNAMEPALGLVLMTMRMGAGGESPPAPSTNTSAPQVDAVALAIQQGRDHGLRPYLYWRRACQLRPLVRTWQDLEQVMPKQAVAGLRRVYGSPEQLDLYLALLEAPAPGATLGPTFVCLLARQFYQLKHGDRYWFENDLPELAFTAGQLEEIRQTSLAKVMCRNSQASISFIQPSPMLASDPFLNAYQYCTNKAMSEGLDVAKWRQVVQSAQQVADEQLMDELTQAQSAPWSQFGSAAALARGKRLIGENSRLIVDSLDKARTELDQVAARERAHIGAAAGAQARARRQTAPSGVAHSTRAGYRYLPRPKRQALSINNQSVIFELATNEVVRSLLRAGKDRERAQSVQSDIRDFLYSLETIQLDNLLDNSAASDSIASFIASANGFLLSDEQRRRLASPGDALAGAGAASEPPASRSSSVSMDCQDDERAFPCDHTSPFRTITGWCNNLQNPKFGQSFTLHDRILPNAYEDGLSRPRQFSVTALAGPESGGPPERRRLPSPRLISTTMHDDRSQLHARYSLALMQFGQFGVDHDLTRTPFSVALDGSLLDCSSCDSARTVHRDCLPIEIPDSDAHFQSERARRELGPGKRCLHFVRSLNGQPALGPRQQLNALTAYLDGSEVYGSDNCEARSLRAFSGGRLNASAHPSSSAQLGYQPREILPTTRLNPECATPSGLCFHAGDQRASEQPGLTAMHTIFLRLHNSIVDQLAQVNAHWSDERLYQQGRRIVGAILQRITYGEFAPRLLGLDYMAKFGLTLRQVGYSRHYDDSCSASILNEFAAAAFRMGHSLIRSAFPLLGRQYKPLAKPLQLRTAFFNSQRILSEPQLIDSILRGIVSAPVETLDNSVTDELTNHLFEKPRAPFSGMDLVSLNIQRARDHGIGGYNRYRAKCNLTRARTFDELAGEVPPRLIKRLAGLYAAVDDIDLFTGGISELPVHGGIIGPTFACIIGMQLARLKRCDRFWHETDDPFVRFTPTQLAELRKMTLAKVICSQSDTIDSIQRNAMDVPDNYLNPRVSCSSLPQMDLSVWRENQKSCLVSSGAGSAPAKVRIDLGQSKRVNPCKSCTCTLEGPACRTAKVDCVKLMRRAGASLAQAMADKSCLVQCAWALDMAAQVGRR